MKVVINKCYGGAELSEEAIRLGRQLSGDNNWLGLKVPGDQDKDGYVWNETFGFLNSYPATRSDPVLVQVIEQLGNQSQVNSNLEIIEVPDDVEWYIAEYDGNEHVAENHRTWG